MELPRKFEFFPIFHYKTILFSSESEFSMKNVIFEVHHVDVAQKPSPLESKVNLEVKMIGREL